MNESEGHEPGDCEECPESIWPMCPEHMAIEIDELRVQLAKVTAERDEARRMAEIRLNAIESIRHASLRATPTGGE
jgi:hypothetical protein